MKLASYLVDGKPAFGAVVGDGVITMGHRFEARYPSIKEVLRQGALEEIRRAAEEGQPDRKLSEIKFLPVIPDPDKIICAGINYRSHAAETGHALPLKPNMFIRLANGLVAHEEPMIRPSVSTNLDFEGELAIIIGKPGRHIKPERALDYVAGYTCFNDGSVRDWAKYSLTAAKNFPGTGPLGPWMVTADEIPDPSKLTLVTRLNGKEMQRSGTDALIHTMPELIAYCSDFTTLSPGDIIATGTPDGIGAKRTPPVWMNAGDVLEIEISGIGTLRNRVVDEKA
jgi:2-keto-4-pentenoate hydratase/2-oxohepta-3-ene-1,7-dioic acid hydratase in catechol pathway